MECDFIPLGYDYFEYASSDYIQITGRTKTGEQICVIDKFEPSFWVILKNSANQKQITKLREKILSIKLETETKNIVTRIELKEKKYLEKNVKALQVFSTNHKNLHNIASAIGNEDIIDHRREYDINLITKYIMGKEIEPLQPYKITGSILTQDDLGGIINILDYKTILYLEKYEKIDDILFSPKTIAYDIETDTVEIGKTEILMISLYSENFKKVLTCKPNKTKLDFVETFKTEKEMLEAFIKYIKDLRPDLLCGYFSDGFDLQFIKSRAERNRIKLNIGLDDSQPTFSRGRIPTAKINGIVHLDIYRFISSVFSQYLQTESLSLNEVAKELIGEEKKDFDFHALKELTQKDLDLFFEYNLQDSKVTYDLFQAIWLDMKEFTKIIKEPLFNICRATMATNCENYILHNLKRFNEIAEKKPTNENISDRINDGKYEGAFVYEPKPNLYNKIIFFDFTSMYGSIIVTYNISKATFDGEKFVKEKGMFPTLLEEIIQKRKKYKKEYIKNKNNLSKARSNAYKLLANASYGYLGFSGARYYSRDAAQATTRFAKENILKTIDTIRNQGFEIIYSDTDSIAFLQGEKTKNEILELLKDINDKLPGIMELDFEDFYPRGIFVSKRTNQTGAKKKYALLQEDGSLKIRGFETVRRDWCLLARNLQKDILESILKNGNGNEALDIFNKIVEKLKNRTIEKKELIMKTQLKKDVDDYSAIGPHVVAAKKMKELGMNVFSGMVIEYFIGETKQKTKKIGDKVFLLEEDVNYDVDYYLNNQIIPAVENIFDVIHIDVNQKLNKQKSLFDFNETQ